MKILRDLRLVKSYIIPELKFFDYTLTRLKTERISHTIIIVIIIDRAAIFLL